MLKLVCSVRDIVANCYSNPFVTQNSGTAMRDFSQACADPDSLLFKSPESYMLFSIGRFDDELGELIPHAPELIANATQFHAE